MSETGNGQAADTTVHKRKRDRSPSYPGINLKEAIAKAETLYKKEGKHKAPVDVILDHWGYAPKSGAGMVALAALKKFGLIDDEGIGQARQAGLTKAGLAITDKDTDPEERDQLVRAAALKPPIHAELWRDFKQDGLPSESNLRSKLKNERRFTENGAAEFIRQFKATMALAKLTRPDTLPPGEGDKQEPLEEQIKLSPTEEVLVEEREKKKLGVRTFNVPLSPDESVIIQMPSQMDEDSWNLWTTVVNAMKPGIVVAGDQEKES